MTRSRYGLGASIAVLAVLALTTPAFAGDAVGEWDLEMDFNGRQVSVKLTIREESGALAGTWSGQRGDSELAQVTFQDGKLSFVRQIERQGQQFELTFQGSIEGDTLAGKLVTPRFEAPITGRRSGAASGTSDPPAGGGAESGEIPTVVGTWKVISESQLGSLERTLVINADGTGSYKTPDAEFAISDLKVDGNRLGFKVTVSLEGQDLPLTFTGKVEGTKLGGEFASEFGNATVSGEKQM